MTNIVINTLKRAKVVFPEIVDKSFLKRYIDDGLISQKEADEVMK